MALKSTIAFVLAAQVVALPILNDHDDSVTTYHTNLSQLWCSSGTLMNCTTKAPDETHIMQAWATQTGPVLCSDMITAPNRALGFLQIDGAGCEKLNSSEWVDMRHGSKKLKDETGSIEGRSKPDHLTTKALMPRGGPIGTNFDFPYRTCTQPLLCLCIICLGPVCKIGRVPRLVIGFPRHCEENNPPTHSVNPAHKSFLHPKQPIRQHPPDLWGPP